MIIYLKITTKECCNLLTKAIIKAISICIPRGCRKKYKPFWNSNIEQEIKNREAARKTLEKNPTVENKIHYNHTSAKVKRAIKSAKKDKWVQTTSKLDLSKDGAKAWSLLSNLSVNITQNPSTQKLRKLEKTKGKLIY